MSDAKLPDVEGIELLTVLGEGGMGIVYKGFQASFQRTVAVKALHKHLYADQNTLQRFLREARTLAALDHPNIVKTFSLELTSDQSPLIVMEVVEGETLAARLSRGGTLGAKELEEVFSQILDALAYAHAHKVVHRDLKPANVMITSSGVVKIMDFGIAKSIAEVAQSVTATGEVIGSPVYMSPEQTKAQKTGDPRSDLYSVGVMLFESVEGHPPFQSEAPLQVLLMHMHEPPPPVTKGSAALALVIDRALQKEPTQRFADAHEFKAQLLPALLDTRPPPPARAKRRLPRRIASTVLLVAVAGALGGILVMNIGPPQQRALVSKPSSFTLDRSSGSAQVDYLGRLAVDYSHALADPEKTQRLLSEAERMYKNLPDERLTPMDIMDKEEFCASIYLHGEQYEKAIPHYQRVLKVISNNPGLTKSATNKNIALTGLGTCYEKLGRYELAEKNLLQALEVVNQSLAGQPDTECAASGPLLNLLTTYAHWGKQDLAVKYAKQHHELWVASGEKFQIASSRMYLGYYLCRAGHIADGLPTSRQAAQEFKALCVRPTEQNLLGFALSIEDLAQCYQVAGQGEKGTKLLAEGARIRAQVKQGLAPSVEQIGL